MNRREPFDEITKLLRGLLPAAATADPPLRPREWRVLAAVLALTAAWSKREDRVSHQQLAAACGLTDSGTLRKELNSLVARGLITYTPGGGRGKTSTVGLPTLDSLPRKVPSVAAPLPARETPVGTGPLPKGVVKNQPQGVESGKAGNRGARPSPAWLPDGAPTADQRQTANDLLEQIFGRLVAELEDGDEQVETLRASLPTLKCRDRLGHWLAEIGADESMVRLALEHLSASYRTSREPAAVFYKRVARLVATLEGDGYQLPQPPPDETGAADGTEGAAR